jgi:hypothetical protein
MLHIGGQVSIVYVERKLGVTTISVATGDNPVIFCDSTINNRDMPP